MKIKHTFTLYCLPFTLALFLVSCGTSGDGNGGESFEASDVSAANCADAAALNCFISQWDTTKTADGASYTNTIVLPLVENGEYDFYVDWGDETAIENITEFDAIEVTHTYAEEGEYTIHIAGEIKGWRFFVDNAVSNDPGSVDDNGDAVKLLDVSRWGSLSLGNTAGRQFRGATNFNPTASDAPNLSETTSLDAAFQNATVFDGAIGNWDVSTITTMAGMFANADAFDQELSNWDVSNVTVMSGMFSNASSFNSPLVWGAKTQNVTNMDSMFQNTTLFDQDISGWNVSAVTDMSLMFINAPAFDKDLSSWNVCKVNSKLFFDQGASATWTATEKPNWDNPACPGGDDGGDTGRFADVSEANCADATAALNCFISKWDTRKTQTGTRGDGVSAASAVELPLVANGEYNFYVDWGDGTPTENITEKTPITHTYAAEGEYTIHIAGEIKGWRFYVDEAMSSVPGSVDDYGDAVKLLDVSQWGSLSLGNTAGRQFFGAANFNPTASDAPNLSETTSLVSAFYGATVFDGAIGNWDVSAVTTMASMFRLAFAFDQDLSNWNVSSVTAMQDMFRNASTFNGPLVWADKTQNVTAMQSMFSGATLFDQNISGWDVSAVTTMFSMFYNAAAFNQDLSGWNVDNVLTIGVLFSFGAGFDDPNKRPPLPFP